MNIVQVLPSLNSGGVERGTLEIAKYLVANGHNSFVISSGGRLVEELEKNRSKHISMSIGNKSIFTLFLIPKLIKFFKENKIDIIHVRSRFPAWIIYICLLFIKNEKPSFVTTVHGFNSVSAYSKIMTKGDKVIAVSNFIKNFIIQEYKVDKKKIKLIYRGVPQKLSRINKRDFEIWKERFEERFKPLKKKKILTLSARISRTKGIEIFIKLIASLIKDNKNIYGLIVGEPKSKNYLYRIREQIAKLGVENNVFILGYRSDIYQIIQYSDITYCLSTIPEPFGRGVIESIKLGVPVIGFDHGGAGEQLREIFSEGIVEYNNFENLLSKTKNFLKNKPKIKKTFKFTLENMQRETLKLYLSLKK